ncbi:MAG: glycosyltransferase [Sediminibacterium sp.]|nr:glycosyltransferase [Sediminibacterium sp.]TXT33842.1 MAG: glycosyl transferase family protein [Chitinophagaceae bacterium]
MQKLLSICIPTFNRAELLNLNLSKLQIEIQNLENYIDIYISDNNSDDNTAEIVKSYIESGLKINFTKHGENIGTELNFLSLFGKANSKYFWLFSDDDFLLPFSLKNIIEVLLLKDFGVVYINQQWYDSEIPNSSELPLSTIEFKDPIEFIKKINYWVTFISGNIINKSIIENKINPSLYNGTMLNYLNWHFLAIFSDRPNVVICNSYLACKSGNTGGYRLFEVFGKNFNMIMDDMIALNKIDKRVKDIINNHLLKDFFPNFIRIRSKMFLNENPITVLRPIFWKYPKYWVNIFIPHLKSKWKELV